MEPKSTDFITKAIKDVSEHWRKDSPFSHSWVVSQGTQKQDCFKILNFLSVLADNTPLLLIFEARFSAFLKGYPQYSIAPQDNHFISKIEKNWFYDRDKKIPVALPIPRQITHKRDIFSKCFTLIEDALILFLYQQLIELEILDKNKRLDEQIFHCLGLVESAPIEAAMTQGMLFVESGPFQTFYHGKYTHLLQLTFIGLAMKNGTLKLERKPQQLVPYLLNRSINYGTAHTFKNGWNTCLDGFLKNSLIGPFGLNVILLSTIVEKNCPIFYRYYTGSYSHNLIEEVKDFKGDQEIEILTKIVKVLKQPSAIPRSNTVYVESFKNKHNATKINNSNSMLQIQNRSLGFQHTVNAIQSVVCRNAEALAIRQREELVTRQREAHAKMQREALAKRNREAFAKKQREIHVTMRRETLARMERETTETRQREALATNRKRQFEAEVSLRYRPEMGNIF